MQVTNEAYGWVVDEQTVKDQYTVTFDPDHDPGVYQVSGLEFYFDRQGQNIMLYADQEEHSFQIVQTDTTLLPGENALFACKGHPVIFTILVFRPQ